MHRKSWMQWLYLAAGVTLTSVPFPLFFIPNDIAPGGLSGLSTVLHALTGWPVGMTTIVLNAPLFLISWKRMGRAFASRSLLCMLGVSVLIDLVPGKPVTSNPMLAAIFGGLTMGAGIGLVIRGGATTGGTDMAAMLVHEQIPAISVGGVLMGIDCLVILLAGIVFDLQSALFALIALYIATRVMDRVIEGLENAKAFFIFSGQSQAIADAVLTRMNRGATLLRAQGAYSRQERDVLLCVVTRMQIPQLKAIVNELDPNAFLMLTDVREALGEGFTREPGAPAGSRPAGPDGPDR
ncbi:MAG: YitT family protein [Christensenellales bacterium]|nr:YitT family protein [Christensenellales bacterium]